MLGTRRQTLPLFALVWGSETVQLGRTMGSVDSCKPVDTALATNTSHRGNRRELSEMMMRYHAEAACDSPALGWAGLSQCFEPRKHS